MSNTALLLAIILQILLILISAAFSMAEIALLTVNRNKLESLSLQGSKKAKNVILLLSDPAKFLATIQVGNTLANFLGSAFAAGNFSGYLTAFLVSLGTGISYNALNVFSVITIILLLSYISIVFAELVPKRVGMKKAESLALFFGKPLLFISKIFGPVVHLLSMSTNSVLRIFRIDPKTAENAVTEEEIRLMIDLGSAGGVIKNSEKEILHNIFEFDNKTAGEVMTHRRDVSFLFLNDSDSEWEKIIMENRHSNFPVCGDGHDDIKGILNIRDYFMLKDRSREAVLARAVKTPHFVPVSVRTDILFRQMKKSRNHLAVTVDEHGSMMGIITMNDLLEQLVGNLENDSSVPPEKPLIEKIGSNRWYVRGSASLDKVAHELGVNLPLEKYDTFAGLVFSLLGYIPEDGSAEELEFSEDETPDTAPVKLHIRIIELKERRLEKALVSKETPSET